MRGDVADSNRSNQSIRLVYHLSAVKNLRLLPLERSEVMAMKITVERVVLLPLALSHGTWIVPFPVISFQTGKNDKNQPRN